MLCCMQVKLAATELFSIHVDVTSAEGNTYRISIGNIFKADAAKVCRWCVTYHVICVFALRAHVQR